MIKKNAPIIFFLFTIIACSPHFHLDFLGKEKIQEVVLKKSPEKSKVLVIDISGVIESSGNTVGFFNREGDLISSIYYRLEMASDDPYVKGVILRLNTPGGEGTASDIIYHELMQFKQKTKIPLVALMMGMATSGGYYIASACDYIIAHPTTITGSIGVIGIMPDFSVILSRLGIKFNIVKSGNMKDSGSPYRAMTPDEKKYFQSMVDVFYEKFLQVVYRNRKNLLTMEKIKELADGRVYIGSQALEFNLVDKLGYFESAFQKTLSLAGIQDASVIAYSYYPLKKTNIYAGNESGENPLKLEIKGLNRMLTTLNPGIYYLWLPFGEK
jgi:protease-4